MSHPFRRLLFGATRVLAALAFAFALTAHAHAQSPTATIEGRVQNAVTGDYLNRARVTVPGTNLVTLTDEGGVFRLSGVPAGAVTLRVFFTGLDEQTLNVTAASGATLQQDIKLTSRSRYGERSETVQLDKFVVESTKETNAAAIAVNEQRFSSNQKSVISADQFGIIPDSNPGELMKWLPGVSVEYFANTIIGVSVRGLDPANTDVVFDGMPVASVTSTNSNVGRGLEMRSLSASDVSRIEVQKLPLPENNSNTLGGTINLIRRSAFEYSRRKIEYRALFTSDASELTIEKREGPKDRQLQWWRPNVQLKWTEPVSKTLGFAVTLGHDDKITRVHWSSPTRNFGNAQQAAQAETERAAGRALTFTSLYNPAKTQDLLHDNPIWNYKDYATAKVDWRPRPELKLSYSINAGLFRNQTADDIRIIWNTGTLPAVAPGTAMGAPGTVNEFSTYGAVGGGFIRFDTREGWRDEYNPNFTNGFEAEWRAGAWVVNGKASFSVSRHTMSDVDHGFFNNMTSVNVPTGGTGLTQMGIGTGSSNPRLITVNLLEQTKYFARTIEARDAVTGQLIDWTDHSNYNIAGATSRQGKAKEMRAAVRLFARRSFSFVGNPLSVQLGYDFDEQFRNKQKYNNDLWSFVGPNRSAAQIASENVFAHRDDIYDAPAVPRMSMSKLYQLYRDHPDWFQFKPVESWFGSIRDVSQLDEKTHAGYVQFKGAFFRNRLSYAGGVRYEYSAAWGLGLLDRGANAVANAIRAGRLPAGTATNSLAGFQERYARNGARGEGTNSGTFPSLHLNYDLTENLKFMIGYAKTQAKNRFDRTVIPNTTINDAPVTTGPFSGVAIGTLNMRNPLLEPWVGHNYEATLAYYTPQGGVISIGAFRKNIHNWQTSGFILLDSAATAADYGFGPEYVNWQLSTLTNDGNGRLDGAEAEFRQPLDRFIPDRLAFLKGFAVTASFNYNDLRKRPGDNISGDFNTLYSTQTKASLNYRRKGFFATAGVINYGKVYRQRDDASLATAGGVAARSVYGSRYYPAFNQVDFSLQYTLPRWARGAQVFLQGQNVTGARKLRERVVEGAPQWSRVQIENNLGQTYTVGVTGSF